MIVDCHHHYVPEEVALGTVPNVREVFWRGVPDHTVKGLGHLRLYSMEQQLKDMDAAGVDKIALGCVAGLHANLDGCKFINDRTAQIQTAYPSRFIGLVNVPATQPEALDELDRAIKVLGLKGVFIPSQVEGEPLDSSRLWPFYKRVTELNVPVFVHPEIAPPIFSLVDDYDLQRIVGREFNLVVATVRLIYGGVLDEFTKLKIVMSHFGGGISSLMERIGPKHPWTVGFTPDKAPYDYLSRIYFDMAGFEGGLNALRFALDILPASQLVFGSDYPQEFRTRPDALRQYVDHIKALPRDRSVVDGMLGLHAERLFRN